MTHTADGISTDMISLLHKVFLLHYTFVLIQTISQTVSILCIVSNTTSVFYISSSRYRVMHFFLHTILLSKSLHAVRTNNAASFYSERTFIDLLGLIRQGRNYIRTDLPTTFTWRENTVSSANTISVEITLVYFHSYHFNICPCIQDPKKKLT